MPICCQRPITNHPTCGDVLFWFATKYKTAFVIVASPCHVETLVHSLIYPAFSNEVDTCTADLLKAIGYVAVPIDVIFASASVQVVTPHCLITNHNGIARIISICLSGYVYLISINYRSAYIR